MARRNWPVLGLGIVLAGLFLGACGQGAGGPAPLASGGAILKATEFKFDPPTIRVEAGKPLRLVLRNEGKIEHDVELPGLMVGGKGVRLHANPGQTGSIQFTPEESGTFEMVCTLPGHKEAGMVGKFEVVAAGR